MMTFWPGVKSSKTSKFSATSLTSTCDTITVKETILKKVLHNSWHTTNIVKILKTYWPEGFKSAKWGYALLEIVEIFKCQINVSCMSNSEASEVRICWTTQLPLRQWWHLQRLHVSRYLMALRPSSSILTTARPASSISAFFSADSAGWDDDPGRLIPITSIAVAIVLAVYIPPQPPPGPGQALHSRSFTSSAVISPWFPFHRYPSKTETQVRHPYR